MKPPLQTVLIADDDRSSRMLLAEALKDECHLILAKNGASALRMAQENRQIRLVLLDLNMPDMNGFEILQSLKSDKDTAHIPVVFVTGNLVEEDARYARTLGAADYLCKPVPPATVQRCVRSLLQPEVSC
jgi:CheY-like chemotaxis protein